MKISSKGLLMSVATWFLVSLVWFLWVRNTLIGIVWLCLGIAELAIAFVSQQKQQH